MAINHKESSANPSLLVFQNWTNLVELVLFVEKQHSTCKRQLLGPQGASFFGTWCTYRLTVRWAKTTVRWAKTTQTKRQIFSISVLIYKKNYIAYTLQQKLLQYIYIAIEAALLLEYINFSYFSTYDFQRSILAYQIKLKILNNLKKKSA